MSRPKNGKPRVPNDWDLPERIAYYAGARFGPVLHGAQCLGWTASTSNRGYPKLFWEGKLTGVARLVLEGTLRRPLAPGHMACHHCDMPGCIEARHLYEGTAKHNVRDMIVRGRRVAATKMTDAQLEQLWTLRGTRSRKDLARQFNVTEAHISSIFLGRVRTSKHRTLSSAFVARGGSDYVHDHASITGESHYAAKLTRFKVEAIRKNKNQMTGRELARKYGISPASVSLIRNGKTWKHV